MGTKKKPRLLGYFGHAARCSCTDCSKQRAVELRDEWRAYGSYAEVDPKKTVFVRAYFRAQKNHLVKRPNMLRAVKSMLFQMLKEQAEARKAAGHDSGH